MRRAHFLVCILVMIVLLMGCQRYSEVFVKEGEITGIDKEKSLIYVDRDPIKIKDTNEFTIGQTLRITIEDRSPDDDWNPDDFKVREIEYIE
ncbi:hypothetical protein ACK8P5_09010 [Paenibacillus sp. EC2-1]|uniref:hypothetical protein n=1 Tax=Paenibacillus sp. EC2-1 TaxID=3388665 RepID=UPI003BEF1232